MSTTPEDHFLPDEDVAEPQELHGEREQCHYIYQKGVNLNKQCDKQIPKGNIFCKKCSKTAWAKRYLERLDCDPSLQDTKEPIKEEQKPQQKYDKMPQPKHQEKEIPSDGDDDDDVETIVLPTPEDEEAKDLDEDELEMLMEDEPEEQGDEEANDNKTD
jgi:hypothetical protein